MAADGQPPSTLQAVPNIALDRAYWYLAGQRQHLPCPPRSGCGLCWDTFVLMEVIWEELWPWAHADQIEREAREIVEFFYGLGSLNLAVHVPGPTFDASLVP
jgi:hypothetical protein